MPPACGSPPERLDLNNRQALRLTGSPAMLFIDQAMLRPFSAETSAHEASTNDKMKSKILWLGMIGAALLLPYPIAAQTAQPSPSAITLWVDGACGMCQDRIENAALLTPGVRTAEWDMDSKTLTVTLGPEAFETGQLHRNIAGVGHDTDQMRAPDEVYDNLHYCCKYRPEEEPAASGTIRGQVLEASAKGQRSPLVGANVFWLGTTEGVSTDLAGQFDLPLHSQTDWLVVSYIGYKSDTLQVQKGYDLEVVLSNAVTLDEVQVTHRRRATEVSFIAPMQVQMIGEKELMKAACCNLSESFETTPAVDVSFTDAVTGTRQIQMLGLASPYIQITRENVPDVRGLAALYGMTYTAGPWIEGMQLSMGIGSVANGFEAIAGQINVELRKPEDTDLLYLNLYAGEMGRFEGNANFSHRLNERWSTGVLLHGKSQPFEIDHNHDGFLDNPLSKAAVAINRWKYQGPTGWQAQFGVKGALLDDRSGQTGAHHDDGAHIGHLWAAQVQTRRAEGWAKIGRVLPQRPYASMGLQLSGLRHEQRAFFGTRNYDADQSSAYANFIYQSIIGSTDHQFRTGASFQWDQYDENLNNMPFLRNEWAPGAFFEYTYQFREQFTAVAGIRGDYHNLFGLFFSPRLHLSYTPAERTVIRASAGRGQRTASIFAENIGILASARNIIIHSEDPNKPYGLDAEAAWNYGLNLTREIMVAARPATLQVGFNHANFVNQIVVDFDQNPQEVHFYNLQGRSYSNSFMAQFDAEVLPRLDLRLAYRYNDVQIAFADGMLEKPLISRHRAFLNLAYATDNGWHFDWTMNWQGAKRIPFTASNPPEYRALERSPNFVMANAQVSKKWSEKFEVYVGAENLFGFTQRTPIIAADDPFGPFFDSSLVWGPIFGRNTYAGLRYRLAHKQG
jgi:outer membrane receptor for ferrienterochelin and colicins